MALTNNSSNFSEIGVVRYCKTEEIDKHEMAITIADTYRKSALAKILFELLIEYARQHGVKTMYSIDLADNHDMRTLANQFGMEVNRDPEDSHLLIYTMSV